MSTLRLVDAGGTEPLILHHDTASTDVIFAVSSSGDLTITPDGGDVKLAAKTTLENAALINEEVCQITHLAAGGANVYPLRIDNQFTGSGVNGLHIDYSGQTPNNTINTPFRFEDATALRTELRSNGGLANFQSNDLDLSDGELKEVYGLLASTWDRIKALEVVSYRYKDNLATRKMVGVVAQQVQTVEPDWFADREQVRIKRGKDLPDRLEDRPRMVYNKDILFSLVRAVQECQARIETLEGP